MSLLGAALRWRFLQPLSRRSSSRPLRSPSLERQLQDPAFIGDITMMFLAIEDAQERADLIAYLQQFREGQIPAVP